MAETVVVVTVVVGLQPSADTCGNTQVLLGLHFSLCTQPLAQSILLASLRVTDMEDSIIALHHHSRISLRIADCFSNFILFWGEECVKNKKEGFFYFITFFWGVKKKTY